ncbi:MAG: hypothetical protein U0892_15085 [Pirellulales bacterium]
MANRTRFRKLIRSLIITTCVAGSLYSLPTRLQAQAQFQELPVPAAFSGEKDKEAERKALQSAAVEAFKDTKAPADDKKAAIRAVVNNQMAKISSFRFGKPDEARNVFYQQILSAARNDEARTVALTQAINDSKIIVEGNQQGVFHPAARVNAMLIIAEADDSKGAPFAPALGALFNYFSNEKLPEHLRCVAMYGFERHAKIGAAAWKPEAKATAESKLVAILDSKPSSLVEVKAHGWMVRRAYDCLGTLNSAAGFNKAVADVCNPAQLPSVRLAAGQYLTRFDLTEKLDDAGRVKLLTGVAQLIDQEIVGWWEFQDDVTKSISNMGGSGGMMGGPGGGLGGYDGGGLGNPGGGLEGGGMPGGYGGGDGYGLGGPGGPGSGGGARQPNLNDTQKWDLRLVRRKLNTYYQVCYSLLKGVSSKGGKKLPAVAKLEKAPKGLLDKPVDESIQRTVDEFVEALDVVFTTINEKSLVDLNSLHTKTRKPLDDVRALAEELPGFEELSPRKKSHKQADKKTKLGDEPQNAAPGGDAPAPDGAAPAGGAPAGGAPAGGAPAGGAPAGGAPAGGAPAGGAPGAAPVGGQ